MKLKIAGCFITVSPAFCCIITLLLLVDQTGTMGSVLLGALIHEIGHCVCLGWFGCLPDSIRFSPFEINMVCLRSPARWYQRLMVALGGIVANLMCACFSKGEWRLIHLFFAVFNSLPIFSMDGYQALSLCLSSVSWGEKLLRRISVVTLILLGASGVWYWLCFRNPLLVLFVLYMCLLQIRAKSG